MNKHIIKISIFLFIGHFFICPSAAHAVIPPDFIFNIGIQIAQLFSIIIIFLTAVFGVFFQFFKTRYYAIRHRKIVLVMVVLLVVAVSFGSSYFYTTQRQEAEYQKWIEESERYNIVQDETLDSDGDGLTDLEEIDYGTDPNNKDSDGDSFEDGEEVENGYDPNGLGRIDEGSENIDENDQLNIGGKNDQNVDISLSRFVSKIDLDDSSAKFISEYYKNIAKGNFEHAYGMSKRSVDYNTFRNWYLATTRIVLDKLVRIDGKRSSIELTIFEENSFTRYGVLMTLDLQDGVPMKIEGSEVRILARGVIDDDNVSMDENIISEEYNFFENNKDEEVFITSERFKSITESERNDFIVLDAREDIEYENGYFPESWHIRFADLKAGQWIQLPKDKFVYVICWSGIRGKEVEEFLRTKKIVASYLENGANGWVESGGKWIGNIKFGEKYTDSRYKIVFTTSDVKKKVQEGVVLVDTREPYKFKQSYITGSVSISVMYTPTIDLENVFGQVPARSRIITVCDGYVNCFDAKLTGVELERRGHQFLGRYNKPWEYGN